MLKNIKVKQIGSRRDRVTLTFECDGDLDSNYTEFLEDAALAVVHLRSSYLQDSLEVKNTTALQQRVITTLDEVFTLYRE